MTTDLYQHRGPLAVITLNNPPVNSLGHALRHRIVDALAAAQADTTVCAVILTGSDSAFCAGADVSEFGTPRQTAEPVLATVLSQVEDCTKPVVAAISGVALGGGLELALACHARVALDTAKLGLPEILLGLIPGAGGTQRLPRLVGLDIALAMLQSGQAQTAHQLMGSGLLDDVVSQDVLDAACARAIALADELAVNKFALPRARDRQLDATATLARTAQERDKLSPSQRLQPAYIALLDALEAATLPLDEGLRRERELFVQLQASTQSRALRHQFFAEREATRLPVQLQATARPVETVAIIGAGTMGAGIAICALDASLTVILLEQDDAALQRGQQRVSQHYQSRVSAGKMKAAVAAAAEARLSPTTDWAQLSRADLVIEAVFEDLAVKQAVFQKIDTHARPGAVLATNTSYLDVDVIANMTKRPSDVLGLHFFSPANVMKLLEVVRSAQTSAEVLATGMALGKTLKKMPVLTGNAFGFIGNRIYNAYRKQCELMLEDGAWPEEVDNGLQAFGFAMGPFAVADLSGLDIAWRMRKSQTATRDPRERYVAILDHLCDQGRLGRKTGAGYYTYTEGEGKQAKVTDDVVRNIIAQASAQRGITRHTLTAAEIQRRALLAMVNEAALLLHEAVASRASDIDVVMVQGYGFPRWEGGPVFWARQQDRAALAQELQALARGSGHGFVVADASVLLD
ncbi:3-hydroxyacyl-CoA dehydrogenase NAD-binding domain-containing protein [Rhodoferax sp.]|uniref:3-hydroxyacyl-CoA dehydrogenase NAD-binding domain-containing protein n=1 Tax=Rhodoferax sp. TaxID=50421 RepID=UPI00284E93E9|nr:3-hydroxyacyl-CoA dehydrogenase NAD-binding domain-containing protein [Rhodoferax sp.]MDR3368543.1 3-hydroxyacyl-CoA dehydrogenase NAD-binding domain-containing protein [Rhodoferax sp.]